MNSYLNFFWEGAEPKIVQMINLLNWQKTLIETNSDFKMQLFCSTGNIEFIKNNYQKNNKKHGKKFYENIILVDVNSFINNYKKNFPYLVALYHLHIEKKNFVFASDIVRLFILNDYAGIYMDLDQAPQNIFPKNLAVIAKIAEKNGYKSMDFFMSSSVLENKITHLPYQIINLAKGNFDLILKNFEKVLVHSGYKINNSIDFYEAAKKDSRTLWLNNKKISFKLDDTDDQEYLELFVNKNMNGFRKKMQTNKL